MKDFLRILAYLAAVIFLGALLAPLLFWAARALEPFALSTGLLQWSPQGDQVRVSGPLGFLTNTFDKFFNRSMLLAAVILLWPLARALKVRGPDELGLHPNPDRWRHAGLGFAAAFVLMATLGGVLLYMGVYRMKTDAPWGALLKILMTAAVVSCIEEFLFRGGMLGVFRRATTPLLAVALTSALYSIVHFLKPPEDLEIAVHFFSGFQLIPALFSKFADPMLLLAGFATLFLVGVVLAWATVATRSLWLAIGLHAGWIMGTMGFAKLTKRSIRDTLPWVGDDLTVGVAAIGTVLLTWIVVAIALRFVKTPSDR